MQKTLASEQIEAFYHDEFVEDQTKHFMTLIGNDPQDQKVVVDVGGGCGFFAQRLSTLTRHHLKVIDMDSASVDACKKNGVQAELGDALAPLIHGDEQVICFNLILHHLISYDEDSTLALQRKAIINWCSPARLIFVNEYIYESYVSNLSGWLIFQITKNKLLSWIGKKISTVIPSFKANTFGVGVRFRSHEEWKSVFTSANYKVVGSVQGTEERVSPPLRLLLIKNIRRDSFLLQSADVLPSKP